MKGTTPSASKANRIFQSTANRGSYKNKTILQPRGGKSWK